MAGRKGAIAFGLVYIPVELFTATQDDAVRFNQLAKDSMKRVRYVKTCPAVSYTHLTLPTICSV